MPTMHATEFLQQTDRDHVPVVILVGPQAHLRTACVRALAQLTSGESEDDAELNLTRFAGKDADFRSVSDELMTVSMFGDHRIVLVEDANEFVSDNRSSLEQYVERPARKSTLVLEVKSWPKNTKLAKKAAAGDSLIIDCADLKGAALTKWISETAKAQHGKQLARDAAALLVELAGADLGLLEQEIHKLATYVGERDRISDEDVRALVGGWKAETTWTMINAVRDGQLDTALTCLDRLLVAGEAPQKILGGIQFVFRRLSAATEIARNGQSLKAALREAGVFPQDMAPSERYLRRIGRPRAERILPSLAAADGGLKGQSRIPFRIQLEQLLVVLSGAV